MDEAMGYFLRRRLCLLRQLEKGPAVVCGNGNVWKDSEGKGISSRL